MLINIFAILYILIKKSDDKFAKFHALQALSLFIIVFVLSQLVFSIIYLPVMIQQMKAMASLYEAGNAPSGTGAFQSMLGIYSQMLPFMLAGLIVIIVLIAIGVLVATGRDIRVPVIAGVASRFV